MSEYEFLYFKPSICVLLFVKFWHPGCQYPFWSRGEKTSMDDDDEKGLKVRVTGPLQKKAGQNFMFPMLWELMGIPNSLIILQIVTTVCSEKDPIFVTPKLCQFHWRRAGRNQRASLLAMWVARELARIALIVESPGLMCQNGTQAATRGRPSHGELDAGHVSTRRGSAKILLLWKKGTQAKKRLSDVFPTAVWWFCAGVSRFGFARCRALGLRSVGHWAPNMSAVLDNRWSLVRSRRSLVPIRQVKKNALSESLAVCCGCQLLSRAYRTSWFQGLLFLIQSNTVLVVQPSLIKGLNLMYSDVTWLLALGGPKPALTIVQNCRSSWLEAFDFLFVFYGLAARDSQDARGPGWDDIGQT